VWQINFGLQKLVKKSTVRRLDSRTMKQLANGLNGMRRILLVHAARQFDFPGVYIFSEASGDPIYIGESQWDSQRADSQPGIVNRC
jgi:hypothetical protein